MEKIAVLDIGSNSVRLLLADGEREEQLLETTRLGQGVDKRRLEEAAVARTVEAIERFCARARQWGAVRIVAFATSAVRDAENRDVLLDALLARCGLRVEVVPGEKEAQLAYLGAAEGRRALVLDIGGASTELVAGEGKVERAASLQVGAVRLLNRFGQDRAAATAFLDELFAAWRDEFDGFAGALCLGVGGTITTLAAMEQRLAAYDPRRVHGYVLTRAAVRAWVDEMWDLPAQARVFPGLTRQRADIIAHGALILERFQGAFGQNAVCASVGDNLRGYWLFAQGAVHV